MLRSSILTIDPLLTGYTLFDLELANSLERAFNYALTLHERAFICHLSAAMRCGHLCIKAHEGHITPTPEMVIENAAESALKLAKALYEGAASLKEPYLSQASANASTPLVQDQGRFYFQRYWQLETHVVGALQKLSKAAPLLACDQEKIRKQLEDAKSHGLLEAEQAKAIEQAAEKTLVFITGGPGTGKTHTAGQLIRFLYLACKEEDQKRFRLVLAAPTGKAATQLQASVLRAVADLPHFPVSGGQTLHRLLGLGGDTHQPLTRIHADCVLIDEASMIDAELMARLLRSVSAGTRLLFLGDADQLPAVDVGALFSDFLQIKTDIGSRVRLSKSKRTEAPDLLRFARSVQAGDEETMLCLLREGQSLHYIPYDSIEEGYSHILRYAKTLFTAPEEAYNEIGAFKTYMQHFRLLSPLREGPLGFDTLNSMLHDEHKNSTSSLKAYPLLITRNQPDLELWNGEMGLLYPASTSHTRCSMGVFAGEGALRHIPAFQIGHSAYGYCVSVHKSQGSEWDEVLLVLPEGSLAFGRQLLYTAATRAKKRLHILAREQTLRKMVKNVDYRCSGITERLFF